MDNLGIDVAFWVYSGSVDILSPRNIISKRALSTSDKDAEDNGTA